MTESVDYHRADFLTSAPTLQHCPPDEGLEIAFAGRSNAGKSSAINALTGQSKLARTSKTPGRTQLINFFALSPSARIVDLPGYGFAKVPLKTKREWDRNLAEYLQERRSLRALVLLMDIRHPLQDYDWQMIRWSMESGLAIHLLLTKADKLRHGPAKSTLMKVARELQAKGVDNFTIQLFSAPQKTGLEDLKAFLNSYFSSVEEE